MPIRSYSYRVPHDSYRLYLVSDIHLGAAMHAADTWRQFLARVLSDPDPHGVLVLGDIVEAISPTDRRFDAADVAEPLRDVRALHDYADTLSSIVHDALSPLVPHVIGWLIGNHEEKASKIQKLVSFERMVERTLGMPSMGYEATLAITLRGDGPNPLRYSIHAHHGFGGGSTVSAPALKLDKLMGGVDGVNLVVAGHHHRGIHTSIDRWAVPQSSRGIGALGELHEVQTVTRRVDLLGLPPMCRVNHWATGKGLAARVAPPGWAEVDLRCAAIREGPTPRRKIAASVRVVTP